MNIQEILEQFDDTDGGEITSIRFEVENLHLTIRSFAAESPCVYELSFSEVAKFRIESQSFDGIEYCDDAEEIEARFGPRITYSIWGDPTANWPHIIGRIVQEFSEDEKILDHYVKETLRFENYRLPVHVPKSKEQKFLELCDELGLSRMAVYAEKEVSAKVLVDWFSLWGKDGSFVLAKEVSITEKRA